jgi:hypothetical protein
MQISTLIKMDENMLPNPFNLLILKNVRPILCAAYIIKIYILVH